MLQFFGKYKRGFLLIVGGSVLGSFLFFGVLDVLRKDPSFEIVEVEAPWGGDKIEARSLRMLRYFFESPEGMEVLQKDFLDTGIAQVLGEHHFSLLEKDLQERVSKILAYTPYQHPKYKDLSLQYIWEMTNSPVPELISSVKQVDVSCLSTILSLYSCRGDLPSEAVRSFFRYQLQARGERDLSRLAREDFSLFGFHTPTDWMGPAWLDLCAMWIFRCSKMAQERGISISLQEAKKLGEATYITTLGKEEGASLWREILLFRALYEKMEEVGLQDSLSSRKIGAFAQEGVEAISYHFPLAAHSWEELSEMEAYFAAVAQEKDAFGLPKTIKKVSAIESTHSELVQSLYKARVQMATREELGQGATLEEVWQWEVANWEDLRKSHSFLAEAKSPEEKMALLQALPSKKRAILDKKARAAWVTNHKDKVEEMLAALPSKELRFWVSKKHTSLPGISKGDAFEKVLQSPCFASYGEGDKVLYRMEEIEKLEEARLLNLFEAKERGALAILAKRYYKKAYGKLQEERPEQFQAKSWEEKRAEALPLLFPAIGKNGFAKRFYPFVEKALKTLQKNRADSTYLADAQHPIESVWKIEQKEHRIERKTQEAVMKEKLFQLQQGSWSSVEASPDGTLWFFYKKGNIAAQDPVVLPMPFGRVFLQREEKRFATERWLEL